MSSAASYSSTTSLVSKNSPSPKQGSHKNYEAALGSLASSYGFGSGVPIVTNKSTKVLKPQQSTPTLPPALTPTPTTTTPKNYEAAFGLLSSSYGFNGRAPTVPSKRKA